MASPPKFAFVAALIVVAGCSIDSSATVPTDGSDPGRDSSAGDGSMPTDGGDAGDSGTPMDGGDSATPVDSGAMDTGTTDSGTMDSSVPDTGAMDSGTPDTGTPDTGTPDTGTPDTGTPATCSDLLSGVPGYRHCGGTPTTQCDFRYAHGGLSGDTSNCNDLCARGGLSCASAHRRDSFTNQCSHFSSDDGCGTNRRESICICSP